MKKIIVVIALLCPFFASAEYMCPNIIHVVDSITKIYISNAEVQIFEPGDSVLIRDNKFVRYDDVEMIKNGSVDMDTPPNMGYYFYLPIEKGYKFDIVINAPGYYTRIIPVTIDKMPSTQYIDYGEVGLERLPKKLDGITVTATKIRMYYKGDTLVYNADAFLLPDGSMLDDLIRKLDGVTIDRNGQIFCKGRKVESMLLEGRKLFNGNPRILLQNLAAYTVKNIKVYDYTDEEEKFLGYGTADAKPLVMDVVLKKEYAIGKWMNIDAGYGTSDRYLGRLFAMGFSKNTSFSAFFNANNLSSGDNPTKGDEWNPSKARSTESTYLSGGLSYYHRFKGQNNNRITGNVSVNSDNTVDRRGSVYTNFISTGDTYRHATDYSRRKLLRIATDHQLKMQHSNVSWDVTPSFTYYKEHMKSGLVSATFDEDFGKVTSKEIESIYSQTEPKEMLRHMINRNISKGLTEGSTLNTGLNALGLVRLPENNSLRHNIRLQANGRFYRFERDNFNRFTVNYGDNPTPTDDVYALGKNRPENSGDAGASAQYEANIHRTYTVTVGYDYTNSRSTDTFDRYLLNNLEDASLESLKFGQIPAQDELDGVKDQVNSKHTFSLTNQHTIRLRTSMSWGQSNIDDRDNIGRLSLIASPSLRFVDRRYDYSRAGYDTTAVRKSVLPAVNARLTYEIARQRKGHNYIIALKWESAPQLFDMENLINVVNDMNPLHVYYGNPHLKNYYDHKASLSFTFSKRIRPIHTHRIEFDYDIYQNRISTGGIYNPVTGVYRTSIYNVNGSRQYYVRYNGDGDLKVWEQKAVKRLSYSIGADFSSLREASLVGITSSAAQVTPSRRFVYDMGIYPLAKLQLFVSEAEHCISLEWYGSFNKYRGDEDYYTSQDTRNITYRVSADFALPHSIKLSTNFGLRTRRGYSESNLNTNEYIWNASASWHWKKPGLTFIADAYDLLRQISIISSSINAFGRSEQWRNTLPSYVLFRVRYHLDISPR